MWNSKRRVTTAFYLVMLIIVFAVAVAVSHLIAFKILLDELHVLSITTVHVSNRQHLHDEKLRDDLY
jgi:cell division septal protein FtsQ